MAVVMTMHRHFANASHLLYLEHKPKMENNLNTSSAIKTERRGEMKTLLLLSTSRAAGSFLKKCELNHGEYLIKLTDVYTANIYGATVTLRMPLCRDAEVLAQSAPLLKPNGVTEIDTYYRVRKLGVREITADMDASVDPWNAAREEITTAQAIKSP